MKPYVGPHTHYDRRSPETDPVKAVSWQRLDQLRETWKAITFVRDDVFRAKVSAANYRHLQRKAESA